MEIQQVVAILLLIVIELIENPSLEVIIVMVFMIIVVADEFFPYYFERHNKKQTRVQLVGPKEVVPKDQYECIVSMNDFVPGFDDEKDASLEIQLRMVAESPATLILHLKGYIDGNNMQFFVSKVMRVINAGFINIIFDCAELPNASEIAPFIDVLKAVRRLGGDMVILNIVTRIFEVFELLGFSKFFNWAKTLRGALNFFKRHHKSESGLFPRPFNCPICNRKLKAPRDGRFRCSGCKTILAIDEAGKVLLG